VCDGPHLTDVGQKESPTTGAAQNVRLWRRDADLLTTGRQASLLVGMNFAGLRRREMADVSRQRLEG